MYGDFGETECGKHHHVCLTQHASRRKYVLSRLHFFARIADVGGIGRVFLQHDAVVFQIDVFLHDNGGAAGRHFRAGHDADAAAAFQAA